jgi:hypothetical protein
VRFTFDYRPQTVDPTPGDPSTIVYRPAIPLWIFGPTGEAFSLALVDSGADETILAGSLLRSLGVVIAPGDRGDLRAANDRPLPVLYGSVDLQVGRGRRSHRWTARVGFSPRLERSILGRSGCLDRLIVTFDGPRRRVTVATPREPPSPSGV